VARGASYLILQTIANSAISLAAFAVIARAITKEDMGGLTVLMLMAGGAQLLTGLGVGSTATQFVASLEAKGDYEKMRMAGYECFTINALMTALIALATFFSADSLASFLFGTFSRANLFRLLIWEIAAVSLNNSLNSILTGLKRFKEISLASIISFAVRQGSVVALLILGLGLPGILIGWGIGDSLNSLLLGALTRRYLGPFRIGFGFARLLKFSGPLFFGQAANYAWTWFDRALLLPLVTLAQLGAYNVAITAYAILNMMPSSISSALFPYYSRFYKDGTTTSGIQDLENAVRIASRYVSLLTIPLAVGLAVTSFPAATLLAGGNYADAAYPLAVLSISLGLACLVNALSDIFIVLGRTVTSASVTIASVLLPILIGFLIIPNFGIVGASIARGASLLISLALSVVILSRILKLRFDTTAFVHAWLASIIMAGVVLVVEVVFYSKYLLPIYVVLGGAVFLVVLRLMRAVKPEDIELLSGFLTPRLRFVSSWLAKLLGASK
jgi:O-antigen/teichoic acid export membrane protein